MSDDLPVLNYQDFVRVRKLHWMKEAKNLDSQLVVPALQDVVLNGKDSRFIIDAPSPKGVFGVFEDDGDVGWLYLFRPHEQRILNCTHIYNKSNVSVDADDVDVVWSSDHETCVVAIWAKMRAFLGVSNGIEMREPVLSRDSFGIQFSRWPAGFAHLLPKGIVQ
jgi:Uncharacterized protein conserved in bacteria (DUF2251)